jgi:hypothetical protein
MTKRLWGIVIGAVVAFATAADAAPVARTADLTISISIGGLSPLVFTTNGATVTVDDEAGLDPLGRIMLSAGAVSLATPVTIPVTTTTSIQSLRASGIANLSGAFSIGGAASNIPTSEFPCPPASAGIACVQQTGLGGPMGFSGTITVQVGPVPIPLPLSVIGIGVGGLNIQGFTFEAAPWTRWTGSVQFTSTTSQAVHLPGSTDVVITNMFVTTDTQMGATTASTLTLVSPTYVSALGNLLPVFSELEIRFTDGQGLPTFVNEKVPEPGSTLALLSAGAVVLLLARRRRR